MAIDRPGPGEELNPGAETAPRQAATVILLRGGERDARGAAGQAHAARALHGRRVGLPGRSGRRAARARATPRTAPRRCASCARRRASRSTTPMRWSSSRAGSRRPRSRSASTRISSWRRCRPVRSPPIDGQECVDLGWFTPEASAGRLPGGRDPARLPHHQAPRAAGRVLHRRRAARPCPRPRGGAGAAARAGDRRDGARGPPRRAGIRRAIRLVSRRTVPLGAPGPAPARARCAATAPPAQA